MKKPITIKKYELPKGFKEKSRWKEDGRTIIFAILKKGTGIRRNIFVFGGISKNPIFVIDVYPY